MTAVASLTNRWLGPPFTRLLRAEVTGADNVPETGGLLVASNHLSFLDHFLLLAAAPRALQFLGKAELTKGFSGRINLAFGMVPVDRGRADLEALGEIVALVRDGAAVAIFPEGTRSPTGELFRFRSGLARVAASAQVPVVPVGLIGTDVVWPRGDVPALLRPKRGVLQVRFGAPLDPPSDDGRARRVFTQALQETIARLSGQSRAERFAEIQPS